jgi:hypothetical protein
MSADMENGRFPYSVIKNNKRLGKKKKNNNTTTELTELALSKK